jgi:hypothetical protein
MLLLAAVALAAAAPEDASAKRFRGHRVFENPSHKTAVSGPRARKLSNRVLRHRFSIRRRSLIFACNAHSPTTAGCDFAFTDAKTDAYTCGNTTVRANRQHVTVRYTALNKGCTDF